MRQYIKRDTHACIEHLVAEATVKLLWVGLWKDKIREVQRERIHQMCCKAAGIKSENKTQRCGGRSEYNLTHPCMHECLCVSECVLFNILFLLIFP